MIDKSLNYQKHQRDYPLLGSTVIAKGLFGVNSMFFNSTPSPIFLVIKDGVFYHFMSSFDAVNRCKGWLSKNGIKELKKADKDYSKKLKAFEAFYDADHTKNPEEDIHKTHDYLVDFSNIVFIGYEMPECLGDEISKEIYNLCFKIREKFEKVHKQCLSLEIRVLEILEKKYSLEKDTLQYLMLPEFEAFLKTKKIPSNINIAQRKKFCVISCTIEGFELYLNDFLWEHFDEKVEASELKGNIAFKGVAKGKVKVIRKVEEAAGLQTGEILVASMTDPRYVPAMKRAGAIVTDEGGITCHAAIVARELKKPCVIGTKVATQVLKDGDVVEVDAEKGIVKILK